MNESVPDKRNQRIGRWFGAASIIASAGSYAAFVLYTDWHWELVRLQRSGESVSAWRWRAVDSLKLVNVGMAGVAVLLLLLAVARRAWVASLWAAVAAIFCLWTVPLIT